MEIPRYPQIPSFKETNATECLDPVQSYLGPRTGCQKKGSGYELSGMWQSTLVLGDPLG